LNLELGTLNWGGFAGPLAEPGFEHDEGPEATGMIILAGLVGVTGPEEMYFPIGSSPGKYMVTSD